LRKPVNVFTSTLFGLRQELVICTVSCFAGTPDTQKCSQCTLENHVSPGVLRSVNPNAIPLNQQRARREPDCEMLRKCSLLCHGMVNTNHNGPKIRPFDIEHIYCLHLMLKKMLSALPPAFRERRTHCKKCSHCTLENSSSHTRPALTVHPKRRHRRPCRRDPCKY